MSIRGVTMFCSYCFKLFGVGNNQLPSIIPSPSTHIHRESRNISQAPVVTNMKNIISPPENNEILGKDQSYQPMYAEKTEKNCWSDSPGKGEYGYYKSGLASVVQKNYANGLQKPGTPMVYKNILETYKNANGYESYEDRLLNLTTRKNDPSLQNKYIPASSTPTNGRMIPYMPPSNPVRSKHISNRLNLKQLYFERKNLHSDFESLE